MGSSYILNLTSHCGDSRFTFLLLIKLVVEHAILFLSFDLANEIISATLDMLLLS